MLNVGLHHKTVVVRATLSKVRGVLFEHKSLPAARHGVGVRDLLGGGQCRFEGGERGNERKDARAPALR